MAIKVSFHGAAGIVTGSCCEVRTGSAGILIDCGMFQGTKTTKELNYEAFPFDPHGINAVILTHAHLDHCGLLPKLMLTGYKGPVLATPATAALLSYMLPDAGYIQEKRLRRPLIPPFHSLRRRPPPLPPSPRDLAQSDSAPPPGGGQGAGGQVRQVPSPGLRFPAASVARTR